MQTNNPPLVEIQNVLFRDLGLINYAEAWEMQEKLFNEMKGRIKEKDFHELKIKS